VEALIFIFLCISWFVKTVSAGESARADQIALRYIISGFLIYFTGSVALFSFGSYIDALTVSFRINIWFLHTLLAIVLYLLIAAGLWKQRRT
jgi:Ca2+/Na+ antiporter